MKKLNLLSCVMLLVGGMIGSAIFSLSGLTLWMAGPAAALSWGLGGLLMLLYGLCMAELACRYPKSGGVYVFPRLAYGGSLGRQLGWLSCWGAILTNIVAISFGAIYVGTYLSVSFQCAKTLQLPLAWLSIAICLFLNWIRLSIAGRVNALVVAVLLLTILTYAVAAGFGGHFDAGSLLPFFTQGTAGRFGFLAALPIAIIGYSAVVAIAFIVSDVERPQRNVPLSMLIALGIVAAIYILVIVVTAGLVSVSYLEETPGMRFIPLFAACFTKLDSYPWLSGVISCSAVLALLTTMLVCVTMNARCLQAASQDGILPQWLGRNNRNGVPALASLMTCAVSMAVSSFPKLTSEIVNFGAVFNILTMVLTLLALVKARRNPPKDSLSFRTPGGCVTPWFVMAALLACHLCGSSMDSIRLWLYTLAFLAIGQLILSLAKRKVPTPPDTPNAPTGEMPEKAPAHREKTE